MRHILIAGLAGGVVGGVIVAGIQAVTTTPLILEAELYEGQTKAVPALLQLIGFDGGVAPGGAETSLERHLLTAITTIGTTTGFMFMLLAAMLLKGAAITARSVVLWAAAAFFAVGLAPALGLAPELPGAAYADLAARQIWWTATVAATAAGIALMAFGNRAWAVGLGIVLIVAPHVVGAPVAGKFVSTVPAELAAEFAGRSLVVMALTWLVPAAIAGYVATKLEPRPVAA